MLDIEQYRRIYEILDEATPAPYDCGKLCGSICCSDIPFGDEDPYIYLLPGEKEYLESEGCTIRIEKERREEHYFPKSWGEYVYIAICPGKCKCERKHRPIQCRTFPLQPFITDKGKLGMTLCYEEVPYRCPFVEGKEAVSDEFVFAAYDAWSLLVKDKAVRDLVKQDSKDKAP